MTKKDYIIIASVFNASVKIWADAQSKWKRKIAGGISDEDIEAEQKRIDEKVKSIGIILSSLNVLARGFCYALLKDNPKFDAEKFIEACGLHLKN